MPLSSNYIFSYSKPKAIQLWEREEESHFKQQMYK